MYTDYVMQKINTDDIVITDFNLARYPYRCLLPQWISTRGLRHDFHNSYGTNWLPWTFQVLRSWEGKKGEREKHAMREALLALVLPRFFALVFALLQLQRAWSMLISQLSGGLARRNEHITSLQYYQKGQAAHDK